MKILLALVLAGSLAFVWEANAQFLNGSVTVSEFDNSGGFFTGSSLSLGVSNQVNGVTGSFSGLVPLNGLLTADTALLSGLSTTPMADSFDQYFAFSAPAPFMPGTGTTPEYRFDFNLATIAENIDNGTTAEFTGTGTIIDTTGAFQDTPSQFIVNFSSSSFYTITLETVPEPTTLSLAAAGLLGALALRRRKG